jgi:hypothetical protein
MLMLLLVMAITRTCTHPGGQFRRCVSILDSYRKVRFSLVVAVAGVDVADLLDAG